MHNVSGNFKNYIDAFFKVYEEDGKSLPKLPYDEDEPSSLYVGEMDEEGWIEWQYVPVDRILDFRSWKRSMPFICQRN